MIQTDTNRKAHIDFLRGIAMIGVIFANFNAYLQQQLPPDMLTVSADRIDTFLMSFNSVFLEWKFMTLFSILFGYGFGVILTSVERAGENPTAFFLRRMAWLFLLGLAHTLFWLGDVLHLYAISGVLLMLFRNWGIKNLLVASMLLTIGPALVMGFVKTFYSFGYNDHLADEIYAGLTSNNLLTLFQTNIHGYYDMYIITGSEWQDILETLGKFLIGYWLLKSNAIGYLITSPDKIKRISFALSIPVMLYWIVRGLMLSESSWIPYSNFLSPLIKTGILLNTLFYSTLALLFYLKFERSNLVSHIVKLGKMTLTNYLSVSIVLIVTLYGIGCSLLSVIKIQLLWLMAAFWTVLLMWFSSHWLTNHRYGPAEWIWRQLSWNKRLPLRRQKAID
jgi:uncharacterized protein